MTLAFELAEDAAAPARRVDPIPPARDRFDPWLCGRSADAALTGDDCGDIVPELIIELL